MTDGGQQRAPQFVGPRDGFGLTRFRTEFLAAVPARRLHGHGGEHPAIAGGQLASGHQHPEFVVPDFDCGVCRIDIDARIVADTRDDSRFARSKLTALLRIRLTDSLQQCVGSARAAPTPRTTPAFCLWDARRASRVRLAHCRPVRHSNGRRTAGPPW